MHGQAARSRIGKLWEFPNKPARFRIGFWLTLSNGMAAPGWPEVLLGSIARQLDGRMVRAKFLNSIVDQAALNGFVFERWYTGWLDDEWQSKELALNHLAEKHNYYALLFSHEFARAFWRQGTRITFLVPSSTYVRRGKNGARVEIKRKPYTRRRLKPDAWKYHLREMACADEPLRYIRRFLLVAPEPASKPGRPRRASFAQPVQNSYFQK